jgi:ribosomal protein S27AE
MSLFEQRSTKMKCPRCGAEMNHHADKVIRAESGGKRPDPGLDGVIIELHSCPACGAAAARDEIISA